MASCYHEDMPPNNLDATNYYDRFEQGGGLNWDLSLMLSALKKMDVARNGTFNSLRERTAAKLLLLGSATSQNLDKIALLDKQLRPGSGDKDKVCVIDCNLYPLRQHQKRIGFITEAEEAFQKNHPDTDNPLPYPSYELAQADMKCLPFADGSFDVVVSDYTLNFAESADEVGRTFSETSRVLSADGFLLLSIRGNPDFPYDPDDELTPSTNEMTQQELSDSLYIKQLPLATYLRVARQNDLQLVADDNIANRSEMLCGVFKKTALL